MAGSYPAGAGACATGPGDEAPGWLQRCNLGAVATGVICLPPLAAALIFSWLQP